MNVKLLDQNATIPTRGSNESAGYDLYCLDEVIVNYGEIVKVKTGISMEIPKGYWGNIRDRSGLAVKNGIHIVAGVIDSDYRGEIIVAITKLTEGSFMCPKKSRIAQMVITPYISPEINVVDDLSDTIRNMGGFGSTGI